jgi:RNA polymerase sigma factor (sigma-70 family)
VNRRTAQLALRSVSLSFRDRAPKRRSGGVGKTHPAVTQTRVRRHPISVEAADEELYRKHADDLTRFATALVGPSNAPDVVSEAVLSCLSSPKWREVTEKRSYLYRSLYNKAAEFHRASQRRRQREQLSARQELVEPPEVRPEVLAAVFRLSMKQRAMIVLTYWEDMDPASIARLMGISEGSVKRHLARGRSRLKEVLQP